MLPGRRYTPADLFQIAWSHKWLILIPWVVVSVGVALFARSLPDRYVAETLLQIIAQRVPQNLVRSQITTSIEERLPIITQQAMTRTRLERLVQELGLYTEQRNAGMLMEDIIRDMRDKHINVAAIKGDAFRVSYESDNPRLAQRVTERLAAFFVDENTRDREQQAENTNQFLETQLDEARRRLYESEKKVEEYSKQYRGQLPSQLSANLAAQSALENRLAQNQENLLRDKDRRTLAERNLMEAEADLQVMQQMAAVGGGDQAPAAALPAARQLELAKAAYAQQATKFTPDYPDMRRLARQISELEAKVEEEALAAPLSGPARARNPRETQRLKQVADLKVELATLDSQIAQREAAAKQLQREMAEVQRRIEATPTRESEMIAITRDYQTLQQIYTSLFQRSEDAKVASNLERRQIGEQFKVIDAARVPERPASPNRLQFYVGGVFGGLLVGIALVGLLEYRDSSFRTDTDVVTVLSLPVLATIPAILTREDKAYMRRKRLYTFAAVSVFGVMVAGAVVVWQKGLLQRIF